MKLNLGAGSMPERGWVNHDITALPGIDVTCDLDVFPWPWEDGSAERIKACDVFEHIWHPLPFMRECWRVLRVGGVLEMTTVHHRSPNYHRDPDHRRASDEMTWDYWVPGTYLNERYGAAYARGCHFGKVAVTLEPDLNLRVLLRKLAKET